MKSQRAVHTSPLHVARRSDVWASCTLQVMAGDPANLKSDVYSMACVMWEALTWEVPFANESHWQASLRLVLAASVLPPPFGYVAISNPD